MRCMTPRIRSTRCKATGKVKHLTADRVYLAAHNNRHQSVAAAHAYQCSDCGWFHLTRVPRHLAPAAVA